MKRLNAYKYTRKFIEEGVALLVNEVVPTRYRYDSKKEEFRQRYRGMQVKGGKLYFGKLQVVPMEEVEVLLSELYKKLGDIGRDRLYFHVKQHYAGISRPQVQAFLNNQEMHQLMTIPKQRKVNSAIVTSKPMERWGCDLIDMSQYRSPQNKSTTFVLTVVDYFSKFAWAVPLRDKTAASVAAALGGIFEEAGAPSIVQTDNGGEFNEEFEVLLVRYGVMHARSRPYKASTNGVVERFNGTLKRLVRSHMLANSTKVYAPELSRLLATYNGMLHTAIGHSPAQVHKNNQLWPSVRGRIETRAVKSKKGRHRALPALVVGDTVRTAFIRKPLEKLTTYWSQELYQVVAVVPARAAWEAPMYVLHDGRRFTRDRLQKVNALKLVRLPGEKALEKTKAVTRTKVLLEPKELPRRERAPTSRLKEHYVY